MKRMDILDIHTHHSVPQPEGVISLRLYKENIDVKPEGKQRYSVGIHPWDTEIEIDEERLKLLDKIATQPEIVAIGETGVDINIGGPLFRQMQMFKHHIELSERLGKPLIIHDVKAHDMVVAARKDLNPKQNWAIHGFRQKPEVADMLLRTGCYLSFGPQFNPDTLKEMPEDRILAETDDSEETIENVIERISEVRGKDMRAIITANTKKFLAKQ